MLSNAAYRPCAQCGKEMFMGDFYHVASRYSGILCDVCEDRYFTKQNEIIEAFKDQEGK